MKNEIKKELEALSPFLSKIEKKESDEVPFMYFENLADQVLEKAQPSDQKTSWIALIKRFYSPKIAMGIATSLLLVAGFWFFQKSKIKTEHYKTIANQITEEEIYEYLEEDIDDFSIETLEEMDIDFTVSFDETDPLDDELLDEILDDFEDYELEQI